MLNIQQALQIAEVRDVAVFELEQNALLDHSQSLAVLLELLLFGADALSQAKMKTDQLKVVLGGQRRSAELDAYNGPVQAERVQFRNQEVEHDAV